MYHLQLKTTFVNRLLAISMFTVFLSAETYAQKQSADVVAEYGENMRMWTVTENNNYRTNIEKICDGKKKTRVSNDFAMALAKKNPIPPNESYMLDSYLNWIDKELFDSLSIECYNYQSVDKSLIEGRTAKETKFAQSDDKEYISCNMIVHGTVSLTSKDLIYIRDGKITKIAKYEEFEDARTGERRVKVDFSDLEDISTLGFTLNHDQHFQAGASIVGQSRMFLFSLDFGFNTDSKKYCKDIMDMTDIMNFKRTQTEYDPKMYVTLTPGLFFKYFSVGCGFGVALLDSKETVSNSQYSKNEQGEWGGISGNNTSETSSCKFMIRPQLKGYIPLGSSCRMSIGVGYDIIPKAKELNGYNVSLGIHFDFDGWDNLFNWW